MQIKSTVRDKSKAKGWTGTQQCEVTLVGPFTWVKDHFGTQTHIFPPKENHSESQCGQPTEQWLSSEIYALKDDTISPAGIHNLKYSFFSLWLNGLGTGKLYDKMGQRV